MRGASGALLGAVRRLLLGGPDPAPYLPPRAAVPTNLRPGGPELREGPLLLVDAPPSEEDCPICLMPLAADCVATPCEHRFHGACLDQYFLANEVRERGARPAGCPLCRAAVHAPKPIEAISSSGRPIEVTCLPAVRGRCHLDRGYTFESLGGFARLPRCLYLFTSNNDRNTPASEVMWTVRSRVPVTVHLNFRSDAHVRRTGVKDWLRAESWRRNRSIDSTVRAASRPAGARPRARQPRAPARSRNTADDDDPPPPPPPTPTPPRPLRPRR